VYVVLHCYPQQEPLDSGLVLARKNNSQPATEKERRMVLIHHKRNDENQFLYQTTCDTQTDTVIAELVAIHNFKLRVRRLAGHVEELAKYGYIALNLQVSDVAGVRNVQNCKG